MFIEPRKYRNIYVNKYFSTREGTLYWKKRFAEVLSRSFLNSPSMNNASNYGKRSPEIALKFCASEGSPSEVVQRHQLKGFEMEPLSQELARLPELVTGTYVWEEEK